MAERPDDLAAAYLTTELALPPGWQLDGLRCASTGLSPGERSHEWRAVGRTSDGRSVQGRGREPRAALADLLDRIGAP
jgi:hypothetical protein